MLQLEQDLREEEEELDKLEKRVRAHEKQNYDQGNELEKLESETDPSTRVRGLMEEVRVWKEKNRHMENTRMRDKETQAVQEEHVHKLMEENRVLEEEVSELLKQKHWDPESIRKNVAELAERENDLPTGTSLHL